MSVHDDPDEDDPVMSREARELIRTELLDTDRQWTIEEIQERL